MKKIYTVAIAVLFIILTLASDGLLMGQPPDPPDGHGLNGTQGHGGSAPLDGGSLLLLLGGLGYGAFKMIRAKFKKKETDRI